MRMKINSLQTKALQGFGILLMLLYHFGIYYSHNNTFVFTLITQYGKICVALFLACSGIGMQNKQQNTIGKDLNRYCILKSFALFKKYLFVLLLAISLRAIFAGIHTTVKSFVLHCLTLSYDINNAWWFLNTYICIIILFPVINRIMKKKTGLLFSFALLVLGYGINIVGMLTGVDIVNNAIGNRIYLIMVNQFSFCAGYELSRQYQCLYKWIPDSKLLRYAVNIILIFIRFFFFKMGAANVLSDTFIVVILILFNLKHISCGFLTFWGKHSTNLWLLHMFVLHSLINIKVSNEIFALLVFFYASLMLVYWFSFTEKVMLILSNTFINKLKNI